MLVGGDLGLRVLVAAFLVLIGPLLGFLVRRKWRHAVARREEIDRLLVFASEEAARAEFEAAAEYGFEYSGGYSFGSRVGDEVPAAVPPPAPVSSTLTSVPVARQLPYQCAQCFSPASTRCSRCKAVRYCSGKCQIIHWRLGHKDECHPPVNNNHDSYGKGANDFKVFRQEANEGYAEGIETEERNTPGSIDASFAEPICSEPSISGAENTEDFMEGKHLTDDGTTNSDSEFSPHSFSTSTTSSESFSSTSISDDSDGFDKSVGAGSGHTKTCPTNSDHKPQFMEQSTVPSSVNVVSSSKFGHVNPSADKNTKSKSSNSTVSSVNGSSESSLSVSSVPSSGFWEGTAQYSRSKVNVVDDVSHPDSEDVIAFNVSDSRLPTNRSSEMSRTSGPSVDEQGPKAKPSDAAQLLQVKDNVDLKRSSLRPESHNTIDLNKASVRSTSSYKESRRSLSTASDACKVEHLVNNDTSKVNTPPKVSDKSIEGLKNVSQTPKARQVESLSTKAPDGHPSSNNRRHDFQGTKSVKIDSAQVTACSSDSGGDSQSSKSGLKSSVSKVVDQLRASKSRHNSLGAWSEIGCRYNNKVLFPYELFVKLFNSKKVELRPFGLTNCGNSCYANAVLQCLAFTPPFTAYFLQGFHSKGCAKKDWCFNCEFESLVLKAKNGNSPLSPIRIISHLENIGSSLGNGREEDAHEFLRYVIETMQSDCLKEAGVRTSCSLEEQTSLIGLTFGGFLRSKIECMRCGGKSERHERIMDLTVEIDGDIASLEGALKQFTHTEILDGENKYHCSRCKSYEKARKKLKILEAPNVLTIALKRFQSGKFGKLNKTITYPEFLNLASYMSGTSDKSPIYQLYGVIEHEDVMNAAFSGHYVCYVKNFQNKWFKVNDSKVKPVEIESVLSKGAYMLLYSRCSPRAPKLIRTLTSHDPRGQKYVNCKSSSHTNSWDLSKGDSTNNPACRECFTSVQARSWPRQTIFEDSSSDNSSSLFSEGGSSTTDSSYRDSISTEDYADQLFGDPGGACWNSPWRISTDSDTSSSSSSPSPLYSRHSRLSNMGHYASGYPETSGYADSAVEDQGFWTGTCDLEVSRSKGSIPSSFSPDSGKQCRHLGGSSSSGAQRLGSDKPFGTMKYR